MNLKIKLSLVVLTVITLSFSGCKDSSNTPNLNNDGDNVSTECSDLKGVWIGKSLLSQGKTATNTISSNCSIKTLIVQPEGEILLGSEVKKEGEKLLQLNNVSVEKIKINVVSVSLKPLTDIVATSMNLKLVCGFDDWVTEIQKDVTNEGCSSQYLQKNLKSIYKIKNDKLFTGDNNDLDSNNYPDSLLLDYMTKQ